MANLKTGHHPASALGMVVLAVPVSFVLLAISQPILGWWAWRIAGWFPEALVRIDDMYGFFPAPFEEVFAAFAVAGIFGGILLVVGLPACYAWLAMRGRQLRVWPVLSVVYGTMALVQALASHESVSGISLGTLLMFPAVVVITLPFFLGMILIQRSELRSAKVPPESA